MALLADASSQVSDPRHQALLLERILGAGCHDSSREVRQLRTCVRADDWLQSCVHQGLIAISNTWTAGG